MNRVLRNSFILALLLLAMGFTMISSDKITVYLIGDSTMSLKEEKSYPETGWGMAFAHFFNENVTIDNRAKNGRSTGSFIREDRWKPVASQLKEGDYVFIQFGHNDESKDKGDRYTNPEDYKKNLTLFITESRKRKAIPVLLTPVSRRKFDKTGKAVETHGEYSKLVKEVAAETGVAFIDLDAKSIELFQQLGEEPSKLLFNQSEPGENPNYPAGSKDNTHFNDLGARKIAQIVLKEVIALKLDLANHIVQREEKKK